MMDYSGAKDRYKRASADECSLVSSMAPKEKIPNNQGDSSLLTENVHRF